MGTQKGIGRAETGIGDVMDSGVKLRSDDGMQSPDSTRLNPTNPNTPACASSLNVIGDLGRRKKVLRGKFTQRRRRRLVTQGRAKSVLLPSMSPKQLASRARKSKHRSTRRRMANTLRVLLASMMVLRGETASKEIRRHQWADLLDDSDGGVGGFRWA